MWETFCFFPNYTCTTKAHLKTKQTPFCSTLLLLWHHVIMLNVMQFCAMKTAPLCESFRVYQPWMHLPPVCWERNATQQNNSRRQGREQNREVSALTATSAATRILSKDMLWSRTHSSHLTQTVLDILQGKCLGCLLQGRPSHQKHCRLCLNSQAELNPKANFCERERGAVFGLGREYQMKWVEKVHFRLSCPFIENEAFLQKPHCYLVSTPSHTEPRPGSWSVGHTVLLEIQAFWSTLAFLLLRERKEAGLENVTY